MITALFTGIEWPSKVDRGRKSTLYEAATAFGEWSHSRRKVFPEISHSPSWVDVRSVTDRCMNNPSNHGFGFGFLYIYFGRRGRGAPQRKEKWNVQDFLPFTRFFYFSIY